MSGLNVTFLSWKNQENKVDGYSVPGGTWMPPVLWKLLMEAYEELQAFLEDATGPDDPDLKEVKGRCIAYATAIAMWYDSKRPQIDDVKEECHNKWLYYCEHGRYPTPIYEGDAFPRDES